MSVNPILVLQNVSQANSCVAVFDQHVSNYGKGKATNIIGRRRYILPTSADFQICNPETPLDNDDPLLPQVLDY